VRFYTGVPDISREEMWAGYWNNRVLSLKRDGVSVTTRKLRYRDEVINLADGTQHVVPTVQEKGIDVRLALDVVKLARKRNFDVAVIFSQDQDLAEVVSEIKEIAKEQGRFIRICCPFPSGPSASSGRGIDGADWFRMDEAFYNLCLDPFDYRPKRSARK
jgi:NYN domain